MELNLQCITIQLFICKNHFTVRGQTLPMASTIYPRDILQVQVRESPSPKLGVRLHTNQLSQTPQKQEPCALDTSQPLR